MPEPGIRGAFFTTDAGAAVLYTKDARERPPQRYLSAVCIH